MAEKSPKSKSDSSLASWKFDVENMVNADPDLPACALNVVRVYLEFFNEDNPHPYCAMSKLIARTKLSAPTIKRARAALVRHGYMVPKGASAGKGATRYELRNPRRELVQRLIAEREAELQEANGGRWKAEDDQNIRDQIFTPSARGDGDQDQVSNFTPPKDQILPPKGAKIDPLITVEITGENTGGAAEAAPHNGEIAEDNLYVGDGPNGRPPTGGEKDTPVRKQKPNPAAGQNHQGRALKAFELVMSKLDLLNDPKRQFMAELEAKLDAGAPISDDDAERLWSIYDFVAPNDEAGLSPVASIPF
ncbi:hypothetical protein [Chelativorans intermedius]|uniref:Helix-turn-helix domain-containing protein n=1 Tax=Chelativorans intermedius TaxID=515947 RepID=A0ABV6D7F8_9HYPH|nr:hypothetical protein [Chelativorans intermedius]MCT8999217.1 hypothetical protein [Chelativorans intermedius]